MKRKEIGNFFKHVDIFNFVFIFSSFICHGSTTSFAVGATSIIGEQRHGSIGNRTTGIVWRNKADTYAYNVSENNKLQAIVVHVSSNASVDYPLFVVVQQQKGGFSWTVPFFGTGNILYEKTSHVLCPNDNPKISNKNDSNVFFTLSLSTYSTQAVNYTQAADLLPNFLLTLNELNTAEILPSESLFFVFRFPDNVDTVLVKATSKSSACSILSIQGNRCPVYDLARNVEFTGNFQSMRHQAGIVVQKNDFPYGRFYVVLVMLSSNERCNSGKNNENPFRNDDVFRDTSKKDETRATKNYPYKDIDVTVVKIPSGDEYAKPIAVPIVVFLGFYIIAGIFIYVKSGTTNKNIQVLGIQSEGEGLLSDTISENYGSTVADRNSEENVTRLENIPIQDSPDVLDSVEKEFDLLEDIDEDKEIYRLKKDLFLSDLSKKKRKRLQKKYNLYQWNLVIIAVFYALPVAQLVFTYQRVLNASGDQDICYYNFYCSRPLGPLSSFNNVYSNIGYVMLGLLFFLLVWRRDAIHQKESGEIDEHLGIPQHYGVFYALGLSLLMEGILSACYHVCPSYTNFQFDTSFMYIIACLMIVQMYQTRHPDLAAKPHVVFGTFAAIILVAVSGVVFSSIAFWGIFCFVLIGFSFYCTTQMYFMGRINFSFSAIRGSFVFIKHDICSCPAYKDRMVLFLLANGVNTGLAINGFATRPKDFASYLLAILIINGLIYLLFYVVMKLRNKEKLPLVAVVCSILTLVGWAGSLTFFLQGLTSWQKSPAKSREHNKDCIVFDFYDDHDIWHFLSAISLFLSLMVLLTLNDDLEKTPRDKIRVF